MSKEWDALGVGHAYAPGLEPDPLMEQIRTMIEAANGSSIVGLFVIGTVFAILMVGFWQMPRGRVRYDTPGTVSEPREIPQRHRTWSRGASLPDEERRRPRKRPG